MSYLDPHGTPDPRGWDRPGDQPGGSPHEAASRYGSPSGNGPPSGYEPAPPYETPPSPYEPAPPYETPSPYGPTSSPYGSSSYGTPGHYETPAGYGVDQAQPSGPTAYRQNGAPAGSGPAGTGHAGWQAGPAAWEAGSAALARQPVAPGGYDPGGANDLYQPGGPVPDAYPPDAYPPGPYEPGRYDTGAYESGPYDAGRYEPGPYHDPYQPPPYQSDAVERYPSDGGPDEGRYPPAATVGPGLVPPTDPVGWPAIGADPRRSGGEPGTAPGSGPEADPYADTQTLPRVGMAPAARPARADAEPAGRSRTSRAGRNLPAAIGVGLALGALIVVPLFVYPPAFLGVIAAAAAVGTWELTRAVRQGSGAEPPLVPLLGGGLLMVGLAWWAGPDALSLALLVTVLATLVWRLGDGPRGFQRDLTAATLVAVYVPFLGGFAALLTAVPGDGHLRVLVTLVAVVLSDTGGYAAGVTFGKHPMAPSVSPKKSWEGFAGSVLAAAGGSAVLLWFLLDVAPLWGALFGMAVSVAAVLGDLGESMIKRDLGIKDMSNLLPGHGGVMDRLDSVLFAMPVAYLLLAIFAPSG